MLCLLTSAATRVCGHNRPNNARMMTITRSKPTIPPGA